VAPAWLASNSARLQSKNSKNVIELPEGSPSPETLVQRFDVDSL
jgi:hypothetical protein